MAKIKSIKYNFIMNFILTASNFIFPLITFPYVSRILLASGNGKIAFVSSIVNYFVMVASLGIPTYGIRICATVRDDKDRLSKTVHELILIHSIMTLIAILFFLISVYSIDKFFQEKELMLINGTLLLLNVLGVNWLYSALEQYDYITIRSIFFKILSIILMFALVRNKSDYIVYGAITIFAAAGSNILNFINLKKFIFFKRYHDYNLKQHMKPIIIFFAQSMAITIYTNLDTVMLGFMKTDNDVGLYTAAVKVKTILCSLVTSLGAVLLPRLSYFVSNGRKEEFYILIRKAFGFVLLISMPLIVYFVIMAKDSILLLSGSGYIDAVSAMQIIIPSILFIGLSNITGIQMLTPLKKEKYVLISVVVGAIVDLIINLLCIPPLGAAGAAFGTLMAEIFVLAFQFIYLKKILRNKILEMNEITKLLFIPLLASIPLILFVNLFEFNSFLKLLISSCLYFPTCLILYSMFNERIVYNIRKQVITNTKKLINNKIK
ncbi:MAG: flippase [Clostridium sp.]|mgnify:FL=1|nr:flippase [[Clostridium] innocuum]MCR0527241.1 flippase [[Clostridium] innocuum]MCR0625921.1 flippase [[Clostridium] innocuum]